MQTLKEREDRTLYHFKNHVIKASGGRWWHIKDPKSYAFACTIFCDFHGGISVTGDNDTIYFGHFSDSKDLHARLLWMGDQDTTSYYVTQKATIGMSGKEFAMSWDASLMVKDLKGWLKENREDLDADDRDTILCLMDRVDSGEMSKDAFIQAAWDNLHDVEVQDFFEMGMKVAPRVIAGWAAIRTLCRLLGLLER